VLAGELEGMLAPSFAAFDAERRRIEAALHDGVQQDLAATAVSIQLALQALDADPAGVRAVLEELEQQVEAALERVRTLAQEIYPSQLLAGTRYPLALEEAIYFSCRALGGERRVWEEGGELRFEIGGAFDEAGLEEARARLAEVGGQLALSRGVVAGAVPLSPSAR
jgi:hypothetical protein